MSTTTTTIIPLTKVYIDDIQLPDVVIKDEFGRKMVFSEFDRALDGTPIIWEQPIMSGQSLDLVGGEDFGWITREYLTYLKELAEEERTEYTLYHSGNAMLVRFRNEDPPVVSAEHVVMQVNPDMSAWYKNLAIKLAVI